MSSFIPLDLDELLEGVRKVEELLKKRDERLSARSGDMQQRNISTSTTSSGDSSSLTCNDDLEPDFASEGDGNGQDIMLNMAEEFENTPNFAHFRWSPDPIKHTHKPGHSETSNELDSSDQGWRNLSQHANSQLSHQERTWSDEKAWDVAKALNEKIVHEHNSSSVERPLPTLREAWDEERVNEYNFGPDRSDRASWSVQEPPPSYSPRRHRSSSPKASKSKQTLRA